MSRATLSISPRGRERHFSWGRKDEEFIADFTLLSRRNLTKWEYQIFRFHFLLGADWKLCCRRLKVDRGTFFHAVYRIMHRLGHVFRETQPYGLYPLDEYFNTTIRGETCAVTELRPTKPPPINPPLREAA